MLNYAELYTTINLMILGHMLLFTFIFGYANSSFSRLIMQLILTETEWSQYTVPCVNQDICLVMGKSAFVQTDK